VSLLKGARSPVRSRNSAQRLPFTNGRTRTFSRTLASSSPDDRAWSDGRRGPAARGLDRRPYASSYIRSFATLHALDQCDRTLQISGLSTANKVFVQGHSDGERARPDGNQRGRRRCSLPKVFRRSRMTAISLNVVRGFSSVILRNRRPLN
jgi:hypothetical protein